MSPRHSSADELRRLPPFAQLSDRELLDLERLRTRIPASPGTVLAREGHPCRSFGILIEGTARVTCHGEEVAFLVPGQHFGAAGILRVVANPVTIVACTAMTLEVMSVREFRSAYTTMPALRAHIDAEQLWTRLRPDDGRYTLAS
jgi:CRP-like cAMP-binding protein